MHLPSLCFSLPLLQLTPPFPPPLQIIEKQVGKNDYETELMETGPRFVLTPIRILAGSFGGPTLYQNPEYVSPNMVSSDILHPCHAEMC